MKSLSIFFFTLLFVSNSLFSQTRPPQNIRRITVTSQYVFENGKKTDKFWAIKQAIFDSLGRCHTEVNFDFNKHNVSDYTWNTFNGRLKTKSEFFVDGKLQTIKEFLYNSDSLLKQEIIKKVNPGDTSIALKIEYSYNGRLPIKIEAYTADGKKAYTSTSKYDTKGTELSRKVKVKTLPPADSVIKMTCKPVYDSVGRLLVNTIIVEKFRKPATTQTIYRKYDNKNNNLIGLTVKVKENQVSREEFLYDTNKNRLQQVKYYNSKDELVKWIANRFEIYRTNDQKYREIDY